MEGRRIVPAAAPGASLFSTPRSSRGERALRLAEWLVLATGIVLFGVLLFELGIDNVLANLRLIGWGIALIVAAEVPIFVVNTLGWRTAFPRGSALPSFGQLLLARIAGDAANYLTPTATMGGEFVRVRMLQGQAPVASLVASVTVAKLTQTLGLVAFVSIGLVLVIDDTHLPAEARWGIFGGLMLLAAVLGGLVLLQRRGLLVPALGLLNRGLLSPFLAPLRSPFERIDAEIAKVHVEAKGRILFSSASFALGFAGGILETYLILWFFRVPVSLELALAVEVLGVAFNNLMFFVPLRAGVQEAGKVLVFAMLGLAPAQGLAAGVVYRIRELTWAFIGLTIMARSRLRTQSLPPSLATSQPATGGSHEKSGGNSDTA